MSPDERDPVGIFGRHLAMETSITAVTKTQNPGFVSVSSRTNSLEQHIRALTNKFTVCLQTILFPVSDTFKEMTIGVQFLTTTSTPIIEQLVELYLSNSITDMTHH